MPLSISAAIFITLAATLALAQAAKSNTFDFVLGDNRFGPDCVEVPTNPPPPGQHKLINDHHGDHAKSAPLAK